MRRETEVSVAPASEPPEFPNTPNGVPLDLRIGEILQRVGKLTAPQIERTLAHQTETGLRFGKAAIALGLISEADVRWALSRQFHYPYGVESESSNLPELEIAANPFSPQSEAIRAIRSQLMIGVLASDQPRRALAVVSLNRGDGKSYFAANLAVAFSQLGARTLLVDANLRTPRQHTVFGIENAMGLSGVLSGRQKAALTRTPDLPNLYIMPVGVVPPNPVELVQRPAFSLLIAEFLRKFDYVIVDAPASAFGADAQIIAAACGAALVIGRQGKTPLKPLDALLKALTVSQTVIAGVTLNQH